MDSDATQDPMQSTHLDDAGPSRVRCPPTSRDSAESDDFETQDLARVTRDNASENAIPRQYAVEGSQQRAHSRHRRARFSLDGQRETIRGTALTQSFSNETLSAPSSLEGRLSHELPTRFKAEADEQVQGSNSRQRPVHQIVVPQVRSVQDRNRESLQRARGIPVAPQHFMRQSFDPLADIQRDNAAQYRSFQPSRPAPAPPTSRHLPQGQSRPLPPLPGQNSSGAPLPPPPFHSPTADLASNTRGRPRSSGQRHHPYHTFRPAPPPYGARPLEQTHPRTVPWVPDDNVPTAPVTITPTLDRTGYYVAIGTHEQQYVRNFTSMQPELYRAMGELRLQSVDVAQEGQVLASDRPLADDEFSVTIEYPARDGRGSTRATRYVVRLDVVEGAAARHQRRGIMEEDMDLEFEGGGPDGDGGMEFGPEDYEFDDEGRPDEYQRTHGRRQSGGYGGWRGRDRGA